MRESQGEDGALEELRKKLYSNEGVTDHSIDFALQNRIPGPSASWKEPISLEKDMKKKPSHKLSGAAIFFGVAVLFFIAAAGLSGYFFLKGGRTVSTDNIVISVQGPTTIAAGDTVPLLIRIENKNPVPISATEFVVNFPEGSRSAELVTEPIARFMDTLGELAPGEVVSRTVRVVLFGEERQILSIPMSLSYKTAASNAVFVKEKKYEIAMTSSPLSVSVSSLSEISVGQPLTLSVLVRSNAATPLENVGLSIEYPSGFSELETSEGALAPGVFLLGTIAPGEERRFSVSGTFSGLEGDERVFHFSAGTLAEANNKLAVSYSTRVHEVTIASPFLATEITLNNNTGDSIVVRPGETVSASLAWVNTLESLIQDGEIRIEISGDAFDRESVRAPNGFYFSSNSVVMFTPEYDSDLKTIQPGDRGVARFSFRTKDVEELGSILNPTVTLRVSVSGKRTAETSVPEQLASVVTRMVKIGSGIDLTSDIVRTVGPFENQGPWPPAPDLETTYTVRLGVTNTINSVADGVVRTTLPSYVRFTGVTTATLGAVTYNAATREVTWNVGALAPNASVSAAFQIGFVPSTSQRGASPILVAEQRLEGFDRFVQAVVGDTAPVLTTQTTNDPAYQSSYGPVQVVN